ncbi:hypothetical protein OKW98_18370 [Pseudomonas sp. KU26590]|uniref:glycine-rich domain-containing protein n=1 Tax=Pseudomonas sp. KU26590 TaxID=2991051 RepID=UPI00223D02BA|nr:hypothetical protein [Pseudomonas sp. KU26590]UZJ58543.1 hypothetical protein OKW98_18370 [Pseudomonas sp. KU26590]
MDRQIVYPGQILPETSLLQMTKDSMIGMAKLASALLGTSTYASGFAVTPTGPASLQVVYAPGEIYSLSSIDSLAFSTLPADTTHSILKQGILLDGGTLSCPAPGTSGQSINYLVQATYQDSDAVPVLLPYYNSANPAMPYSGLGNNGLTQNTVRKGIAVVNVKAGASAATSSQTTPAPDAGYVGLYVVTVAFGQTTITTSSIAVAAGAPIINSTIHGLSPVFNVPVSVPAAVSSQQAINLGQLSLIKGIQKFTSNSSFTVPAGVTLIWASGCAAGGGAGSTLNTNASSYLTGGSGGGAGQSVIRQPINVTPGQIIQVVIGAPGAGGTAAGNNATAGGATQLGTSGSLLNLIGGSPGTIGVGGTASPGNYAGPFGGAGYPNGGAAADTTVYAGGVAAGGFGGVGASTPFGNAGAPGRGASGSNPPGLAGSGYGAGGSGAGGAYNSTVSAPGGAGAAGLPGILIIEW